MRQIERRYSRREGEHEEEVSRMAHLADRLYSKCSEYV
jgi:hypothetical protein